MRSYKVFGIKDGGAETYIDTVYDAEDGKLLHNAIKAQGYWDQMIVRDVLGGKVMHKDFRKETA